MLRNELLPFIAWPFVSFSITITGNTVVIDINFKNLNFNNLTKLLLVLTMFIQMADNPAKLMETRIILTFANRQHIVQKCYAPSIMFENVSHVSCLKIFAWCLRLQFWV